MHWEDHECTFQLTSTYSRYFRQEFFLQKFPGNTCTRRETQDSWGPPTLLWTNSLHQSRSSEVILQVLLTFRPFVSLWPLNMQALFFHLAETPTQRTQFWKHSLHQFKGKIGAIGYCCSDQFCSLNGNSVVKFKWVKSVLTMCNRHERPPDNNFSLSPDWASMMVKTSGEHD